MVTDWSRWVLVINPFALVLSYYDNSGYLLPAMVEHMLSPFFKGFGIIHWAWIAILWAKYCAHHTECMYERPAGLPSVKDNGKRRKTKNKKGLSPLPLCRKIRLHAWSTRRLLLCKIPPVPKMITLQNDEDEFDAVVLIINPKAKANQVLLHMSVYFLM